MANLYDIKAAAQAERLMRPVTSPKYKKPVMPSHPYYPERVYQYSGVYDFVKELERIDWERNYRDTGMTSHLDMFGGVPSGLVLFNNYFNVAKNFAEALTLARKGWREGMLRLPGYEAEITKTFVEKAEAKTFSLDLVGDEVELGAYMREEPEHMISLALREIPTRAPHIYIDLNYRCNTCAAKSCTHTPVNPEFSMIRGAAVTALVKLFNRYGYRPAVTVGTSSFINAGEIKIRTPDKRQDQKAPSFTHVHIPAHKRTILIDVVKPGTIPRYDDLLFVTAHDSFVRRLLFRFEESLSIIEAGGVWMGTHNSFLSQQAHALHSHNTAQNKFGHTLAVGTLPLGAYTDPKYFPNWHHDPYRQEPMQPIYVPSNPEISDRKMINTFLKTRDAANWLLDTLANCGIEFFS